MSEEVSLRKLGNSSYGHYYDPLVRARLGAKTSAASSAPRSVRMSASVAKEANLITPFSIAPASRPLGRFPSKFLQTLKTTLIRKLGDHYGDGLVISADKGKQTICTLLDATNEKKTKRTWIPLRRHGSEMNRGTTNAFTFPFVLGWNIQRRIQLSRYIGYLYIEYFDEILNFHGDNRASYQLLALGYAMLSMHKNRCICMHLFFQINLQLL